VNLVTYPATPTQQAATMQYFYDPMGRVQRSVDQGNNTTTKTYDQVGRLTSLTDACGSNPNPPCSDMTGTVHTTSYTYDLNGNLASIQDANQHTTQFQYDTLNRRSKRTLPHTEFETYQYDALGRLQSKTDFNGKA